MPPAFPRTIGSAALKPQSSTTSCTAFTHVEPNRPPDTNVAVMTSALIIVPTQRGTPATTVSTAAPAMSWPARIDSVASQISDATMARTVGP